MLLAPLSSIASRDPITVVDSNTVHTAIALMQSHSVDGVIVVSPDNGLRIITAAHVMSLCLTGFDFGRPLSDTHLPSFECMQSTDSIDDAIAALERSATGYIGLIDGDLRLVGMLSYEDLIASLERENLPDKPLEEIVPLSFFSVLEPEDSLKQAMLTMLVQQQKMVLVRLLGGDVGIVAQSNIMRAFKDDIDAARPVVEFLTTPVVTVPDDVTLRQAISDCSQRELKCLVIADSTGQITGVLSHRELVLQACNAWRNQRLQQEKDQPQVLDVTENEQRWRAVLEGTQQGVWDWNAQTNRVYFSSTWKSMLGYRDDEIGDSLSEWDSRIHPDDKASAYADLERHFSGQTELYENTHRVLCKDGHYKWILDRGKVFSTDAQGKPLRVIGTHTDVTSEYEQKQKLNRLAENVPGVLYQYRLYPDGHSCFPFATQGILDVYGVTPEQVEHDAHDVLSRLHPEDSEVVATSIAESASTLKVWEIQYRYNHPTKGQVWLEGCATPEKAADGSVIWNGYINDITERKQQELKLAETTAQFQLTMEATDTGLWGWDLLTNKVSWSSQAYRMLGYEPDAFGVTLEKFKTLMHPDDIQPMMAEVMSSIERGEGFSVQFRLSHAQGHWVWIRGSGMVTGRDEAGKPVLMTGTHVNINVLKQTEEKLNQSRERLLLATQSADLGIWDLDMKTGKLEWDPGMFSLYGISPEAFNGHVDDWSNALLPEHRDKVVGVFESALADKTNLILTMPICRQSDNETRILHGEAKVIRDLSGEVVRVVGINRDITEQEEARHALAKAKVEAEAANRAKSDFLANMSHEIRTPMSGIIGLSQISMDEQNVTILQDRLRKIHRSGRLLLGIINDVLDYSRIESGKLEIDPQPFFLSGLLDNLKSLFAQMATGKGLELNISADQMVGTAYIGDELRLRQVLTNLIGNAIKFTEQGQVSLHVSANMTSEQTSGLTFSVSDTGIGISKEQAGKLFQAFGQANQSVARLHGGSGLGLVISQRLVEAMGGEKIYLESELNKGSSFSFTLVMPKCSPEQEQALRQSTFNGTEVFQKLQGQVLLVEDNLINQEVGRALLERFGLDVVLAGNGAEALNLLVESTFDLILMDLQMPVMDGYEATRILRSQGFQLPVIALSAAVMADDQARAREAGMNGHLAKPIDVQELYDVLKYWLNEEKSANAVTREYVPTLNTALAATNTRYMDTVAGLAMLGGNRQLYRKVLTEFLSQLNSDFSKLPIQLKLLSTDDAPDEIARVQKSAHSLKGVAGNLALNPLSELAAELDGVLKRNQIPTAELQASLEYVLQQTALTIEYSLEHELADSTEQTKVDAPVSQQQIKASLDQLMLAVANSEYIDPSELARLGSQLPEQLNKEDWQQLSHALDQFDFEAAHHLLSRLKQQLQVVH